MHVRLGLLSRAELLRRRRQNYPDYHQIVQKPIALSDIRHRVTSGNYKDVNAFRDDFRLMIDNARKYNQEGSWVYADAEEMEKVFDSAWDRYIMSSGLPGALPAPIQLVAVPSGFGIWDDERPGNPRSSWSAKRQVVSDNELLTPIEDKY